MSTVKQVQNVRPYRVPRITPEPIELEAVTLDDFDLDDIREYLHRQDNHIPNSMPSFDQGRTNAQCVITPEELCRIETLAICGQADHARAELLRIVSDHIGRPL